MIKRNFFPKLPLLFTIVFISGGMLIGCASKRYMNKALELENAGLIVEAADLYLRSLQANDDNVDSKLGLKRTGQVVLDQKSEEFLTFYRNRQNKEAVYAFLNAEKYKAQVKQFGIDLNFSENNYSYYQEVKDIYLNHQYGNALNALDANNFNNALRLFTEILKIEPNYRDATQHWKTARYEPVYRDGLNYLQSQKHRKAYYAFDEIIKDNGEYKESSKYLNEAREKALIRIGVLPFSSNKYSHKKIVNEIRTHLISNIIKQNSPFYEIVESKTRNNPEENYNLLRKLLLTENESFPRDFSNIDAVLTGKIRDYSSETTTLQKTRKKAWLKEIQTIKDEDGTEKQVPKYSKVYYYEYSQKSHFNLSITFSLSSTRDKMVMVSNFLEKNMTDHIKYARFDGDYRKLVPGTWYSLTKESQLDNVFDDKLSVSKLHKTFEGRQKLNSSFQFKRKALAEISDEIAQKIINYNPEI